MNIKRFIIFPFILLISSADAQDSSYQKFSLEQCIKIALKNNLDVQQSQLQAREAKVGWQQSKENLLPAINASAVHGIDNGKSINPFTNTYINQQNSRASYNLSGSILLFNGFAYLNNMKQNKFNYQAAKMDEQNQKDQLTLDIILTYLQVLTNNDLLTHAKQQQQVSLQQVKRLAIRNKSGDISPSEYYDLKGQYADDQIAVINAGNSLENAKLSLAQLMNIHYDSSLQVKPLVTTDFLTNYDLSAGQLYKIALAHLASVKAAELHKQSAGMAVKTARSTFFPSIYFNAGLSTNYSSAAEMEEYISQTEVNTGNYVNLNGDELPVYAMQKNYTPQKINYNHQLKDNINSSFSISLNIPILNGLQTRNKVFLAKLDEQNYNLIEQTTKIQLKQSIDKAYLNMVSAKRRYVTLSQQVKDFKESFRSAEVKFNAGVINSVDYLVAKKNLDNANTNLIEAAYDFILRKKILDYYKGNRIIDNR